MASIELPRALVDYFAFAETTPTREGRRFSITLPYVDPQGRLDRLQWWYHLSEGKERVLGERGLDTLRSQAIERFHQHIDQWLQRTGQVLCGPGPIPNVVPSGAEPITMPAVPQAALESDSDVASPDAEFNEAAAPQSAPAGAETNVTPEAAPPLEMPAGKSAFG